MDSPDTKSPREIAKKLGRVAATGLAAATIGSAINSLRNPTTAEGVAPITWEYKKDDQKIQVETRSNLNLDPAREIDPIKAKSDLFLFLFKKYNDTDMKAANDVLARPKFLESDQMRILNQEGNLREDFIKTVKYIESQYSDDLDHAFELVQSQTRFKNINPAWREVLKGIIYIESKGHPHPESDDLPGKDDRGLCQVRPIAVEQALKFLPWKKAEINLWDPTQNISIALVNLLWAEELFEDPSLAIETYNDGSGNISEAIKKTGNPKPNVFTLEDSHHRVYARNVIDAAFFVQEALKKVPQTRV